MTYAILTIAALVILPSCGMSGQQWANYGQGSRYHQRVANEQMRCQFDWSTNGDARCYFGWTLANEQRQRAIDAQIKVQNQRLINQQYLMAPLPLMDQNRAWGYR